MVHAHDNEAAMLEGVMIPLGFSVQEEIDYSNTFSFTTIAVNGNHLYKHNGLHN